jgi:hypothetical protein
MGEVPPKPAAAVSELAPFVVPGPAGAWPLQAQFPKAALQAYLDAIAPLTGLHATQADFTEWKSSDYGKFKNGAGKTIPVNDPCFADGMTIAFDDNFNIAARVPADAESHGHSKGCLNFRDATTGQFVPVDGDGWTLCPFRTVFDATRNMTDFRVPASANDVAPLAEVPSLGDMRPEELRSLAAVSPDGRAVAVAVSFLDAIVDPFFFARITWFFAERAKASRVRAFVDVNKTILATDETTALDTERIVREAVLELFTVQCPTAVFGGKQSAYNYLRDELRNKTTGNRATRTVQNVVAEVRTKQTANIEIDITLGRFGEKVDLDTVEGMYEAFVTRYRGARQGDTVVRSWRLFLDAFGGGPHLLMFYSFQTDWSKVMMLTATEQQCKSLRFFKSVGDQKQCPVNKLLPCERTRSDALINEMPTKKAKPPR